MNQAKYDQDHWRTRALESPFHARVAPLNRTQSWCRWKDYLAAEFFHDAELEYFAIRNAAAVFDLTPMSKHRVTGPDAPAFLDRMVCRNLGKLRPGRVCYAVWTDDDGQTLDDGTLFHLSDGSYRVCSQERQYDWMRTSTLGFDVRIEDETHDVAALALQGPTSCAVLKALGLTDIQHLRPYRLADFAVDGRPLMVSRTGFTGDLGYELWTAPEHAEALWDRLFEAGRLHGITPMGTASLAMARVEAGFLQAGVEFVPADQAVRSDATRSPLELGLEWLVDFSKPNFTGRVALLAEQARGPRRRLARLDIDGNKPAVSSFIFAGRKNIGTVTSAMWSPSAKANIALADLQRPWGRPGEILSAEIYSQRELRWTRIVAPCRVVEKPFWNPPRRWATPAGDF